MIVPTLCVGMHPVTLRVASRKTRNVRRFIDAERRGLHYHAERGNDQTPSRLKPVPLWFQPVPIGVRDAFVGPALAGKRPVVSPSLLQRDHGRLPG